MKYAKHIIAHEHLYLVKLIKDRALPFVLFVNGGPGMSCAVIETLIADHSLFERLNYNIICYDQRNVGRSMKLRDSVSHQDNIDDLRLIIELLHADVSIHLSGVIGHSYGVKLVADAFKQHKLSMPVIFLSMADSIITPRMNNLMLDLAYLKKTDENKYIEIYSTLNEISIDSLWKLTEELAPLFKNNKDRPLYYWANIERMKLIQGIQEHLDNTINQGVFMSVRKDLYSDTHNLMVDTASIASSYLWINGFHDCIMNSNDLDETKKIIFMQSSHYPHIEENIKFCMLANKFFSKNF